MNLIKAKAKLEIVDNIINYEIRDIQIKSAISPKVIPNIGDTYEVAKKTG